MIIINNNRFNPNSRLYGDSGNRKCNFNCGNGVSPGKYINVRGNDGCSSHQPELGVKLVWLFMNEHSEQCKGKIKGKIIFHVCSNERNKQNDKNTQSQNCVFVFLNVNILLLLKNYDVHTDLQKVKNKVNFFIIFFINWVSETIHANATLPVTCFCFETLNQVFRFTRFNLSEWL